MTDDDKEHTLSAALIVNVLRAHLIHSGQYGCSGSPRLRKEGKVDTKSLIFRSTSSTRWYLRSIGNGFL